MLAPLRSGQLDIRLIAPKVFPMADLAQAMEYAAKAQSLECFVTARDR